MERNEGNAFCISCGAKLREDAKFCPQCGAKRSMPTTSVEALSAVLATPASPSAPAPAPASGSSAIEVSGPVASSSSGLPAGPDDLLKLLAQPAQSEQQSTRLQSVGTAQFVQPSSSSSSASSVYSDTSRERPSDQRASTSEEPKKSGGFWDKLSSFSDGVSTVQCIVFGLIYLIGGIVVAFSQGYWASLLVSLYGVYLLWPSDHFKLLIW